MDLAVFLDSKSAVPIFIQLSQALKTRIQEGNLTAGTLLPPTRELAQLLGLSRGTVLRAYDDLIAQGYLEAITGSGTFVSRRAETEAHTRMQLEQPPDAGSDCPIKITEEARKLLQIDFSTGGSGSMPDLNYGAPPCDLLPTVQWKEVLAEQIRVQQPHHFDSAPENLGNYKLRHEIAAFLARSRGLNCQPEQVVVFPGPQQALMYISRFLVGENDTVVVENPGYGGARDNFNLRNANVVPVDVDRDGLDVTKLAALESNVKLVYVSPSYHDPTGTIMSLERRKALLQWASSKQAVIVEDGWDSDYVYVHPPLPCLQSLDSENRVIYLYSFWKLLFPLLSVGCAVVPLYLVPLFDRVKYLNERCFPVLEHRALADFISEGKLDKHIKKTRKVYESRRKAMTESLFRAFKTKIEIHKQSAGMHLCVRFAPALAEAVEKAAAFAGLPIVSTVAYYFSSPRSDEFLIPFAEMPEEEITEKVVAFAKNINLN